MIILHTNVVSEPMRSSGNPAVHSWLDAQVAETLYLTATSLSELLMGIELLPELLPGGKHKEALRSALSELLLNLFGSRILPFDQQAAVIYPPLVKRARAAGHSISMADGQIAAIAAVHGFTVATRDLAPFKAAGVPVINPWQ